MPHPWIYRWGIDGHDQALTSFIRLIYIALMRKNQENEDAVAIEKLIDSYLPILGTFFERWAIERKPSMKLIYQGIVVLEDSIQSFNFPKDNPQFSDSSKKR